MRGVRLSRLALLTVALAPCARAAPMPPPFTASHYLRTADPAALWDLGCALGRRDLALPGEQDSLAILDFGQPWSRNGVLGSILPGSLSFVTLAQVLAGAEGFALGYWTCSAADTISRVRLAVGTNNFCRPDAAPCHVTKAHGEAWARTVNDLAARLSRRGATAQVTVAGASDIELHWNSPSVSRAWVDGYDQANSWALYDYGDAAGCPPAGSCANRWTREDVWYVSWGAPPCWPVPQVYAKSGINARQWADLSLYARERHGTAMRILGSLTQYQACKGPPLRSCPGTDNTPEEGWTQLWTELDRDPRTSQPLRWSADMRWQ